MNATLPLSLIKRVSITDGLTLLEVVPRERILALLQSNLLLLTWDWDNYPNEEAQISAYLAKYNIKIGGIMVKYGKPKHKWGRSFPYKSLGLSSIRREVRNALIKGLYYDCDLKNAQPEIIRNLCEANNISCVQMKKYCSNRDGILEQVQQKYGVDRQLAKDLFIRICFGGTFEGWSKENCIQKYPTEFIVLFERELEDIVKRIKKENPSLYETARKMKTDNGEGREKKILGSFFALFNQEYENRIVEAVLCYLINQTDLMKYPGTDTPVGTYEYDGLKLWKENVDRYEGGIDAVLSMLNEKTFELTGFHLEWSAKSLDDGFDIDEWLKVVEKNAAPNATLYEEMSAITKAIDNADCGIVETIMKILPNHFIYSVNKEDGSRGEWFGWNGSRWERSDAPLRKAIMYEVEKHWRVITDKWDAYFEDTTKRDEENYGKLYLKTLGKMKVRLQELKTARGVCNVASIAKTLMTNYSLEFDTNPDLFGCENGVIDIENACFRPYRFDDFITFSCGFNFTPYVPDLEVIREVIDEESKTKELETIEITKKDQTKEFTDSYDFIMSTFKQIFPDKKLRDYFFKIISTGMSGRSIEKFFVFNGGGRNGKGLTNEFLERVLGDYCANVSPIIYCESQKTKTSSGANPEIAKLDKKRYIISKEPPKDCLFHNSVIKGMTGGGEYSARMLYSSISKVRLFGTNVLEVNEKPNFSEEPIDADKERIDDILFGSKFASNTAECDKKKNIYPCVPGLKETLKSSIVHRNTMLNILLINLIEVSDKGYNLDYFRPESVRIRSLVYLQNSYIIHNIFTVLFEERNEALKNEYINYKGEKIDEDWTLSKIASRIQSSGEFYDLSKQKRAEYSKPKVIEDFFRKNDFYKSSVYIDKHRKATLLKGWRLKLPNTDADADEEVEEEEEEEED